MDTSPETLARLRLEQEFGVHADAVLNAGILPQHALQYMLQLRLQEAVPSTRAGVPPYPWTKKE